MDSISLIYSFCGQMYGWIDGRKDGWIDSVSLIYSFCGGSDVWMDSVGEIQEG